MGDSRFTEAEQVAQLLFRKPAVYCETFATSYG
jgi:hypothetical protein